MNRIDAGYQLYLKGKVELIKADKDGLLFEVEGSDHGTYQVEYDSQEAAWICICPDYHGRHQKAMGSFTCKHIDAAFFKLAAIKGLHEQKTLDGVKFMSKPEMKKKDGKIYAKCRHCGKWADVTDIVPWANMDNWVLCEDCEKDLPCPWGPRDELDRAALDHRGQP